MTKVYIRICIKILFLRIDEDKKKSQIIRAFKQIKRILTTPVSNTEIKGRFEKVSKTNAVRFVRLNPKKNHSTNNRAIPIRRR